MSNLVAYTDGACRISNPGLCSCAFVVYEDGEEIARHGKFLGFGHTNNFAEYMGVIDLLEWAVANHRVHLEIWCDSMLVVNQLLGRWQVRPPLSELCDQATTLLYQTESTIQHLRGHAGIPGNEAADQVCNEILDEVQQYGEFACPKTQ